MLLILIVFIPALCFGQNITNSGLNISYYGDFFTHPGVKFGYEITIKQWDKIKTRKTKERKIYKSLILLNSASFYYHKGNHLGLIILPEIGIQKIRPKGFKTSWFLGLGYHRSILDSKTYFIDENASTNNFNSSKNFAQTYTFTIVCILLQNHRLI